MKHITTICRYLVGLLFIFSGLIKANDPLGFSYKLMEYFEVFSAKIAFLHPMWELLIKISLPVAMFLVVLEALLGVAVIAGYGMKLTSWALLLLILFFTALTFGSAQFKIVQSCGCFGDAIPLTPWQSFTKDLVLLILVLVIFSQRKKIQPGEITVTDYVMQVTGLAFLAWLSTKLEWFFPVIYPATIILLFLILKAVIRDKAPAVTTFIAVISLSWFTGYCYNNLPMKDFRAYATGKSIPEQMQGVPDSVKYIYNLKNKATGEKKQFDKFPPDYEKEWDYLGFDTQILKKGKEAKIHDFNMIGADGADYTEDVTTNPDYNFLLVEYDLNKTNREIQTKINGFAEQCKKDNIPFMAVTSSDKQLLKKFKEETHISYDFYFADQITLKTIIRSNPGLVLLKNGVVKGQWHWRNFPDYSELKKVMVK